MSEPPAKKRRIIRSQTTVVSCSDEYFMLWAQGKVKERLESMLHPDEDFSNPLYWRPDYLQKTLEELTQLFAAGGTDATTVAHFLTEHLEHLFLPRDVPKEKYLPVPPTPQDEEAVKARVIIEDRIDYKTKRSLQVKIMVQKLCVKPKFNIM